MEVQTIKTGKCPACGSDEVYDNRGKSAANHRKYILVSAFKSFSVEAYVCLECGYFEEHVPEADLKDRKLIENVRENWKRVQ